jgi:hypothetical protein
MPELLDLLMKTGAETRSLGRQRFLDYRTK